jgi:3-oxoacyl-[acyl-carrier protein] reductase
VDFYVWKKDDSHMRFQDNTVMITGAGSGIGRTTAVEFAKEGAEVLAIDKDSDSLNGVVEQINDQGADGYSFQVDITDKHEVADAVDEMLDSFAQIDILCNIAGVWDDKTPLLETSKDLWDQIIDVNLTGTYNCTHEVLPEMLDNGGGTIVNLSSVSGQFAGGGGPSYVSAKHGVIGFTKQITYEYAPEIRANVVCPGLIETEMTSDVLAEGDDQAVSEGRPANRVGKPKDVADTIKFLASDESDFIYGSEINVDGGSAIN